MKPIHRFTLVPLSFLVLAGCEANLASQRVAPPALPLVMLQTADDADERDLAERDRAMEAELRGHGLVYDDPILQGYLDALGARLAAASGTPASSFRFVVLRDPAVNAFALSQGGIYVHAGLLARLDNEAQLAHVLAHEIAHTRARHQLGKLRDLKSKTVTAKLTDLAFAGLASPIVALTYAASVNGYGREQEQQADLEGLQAMAAAGYDPQEAVRVFANLKVEPQMTGLQAYFYSNHPADDERARYLDEIVGSGRVRATSTTINAEAYRAATRAVVLESVRLCLLQRLYQTGLESVDRLRGRRGEDAWFDYYAAEAHRLMAQDPEGAAREAAARQRSSAQPADIAAAAARAAEERQSSLTGYRRALERDPSLALAHRGIGLIAHASGDRAGARAALGLYLSNAPQADDLRHIEKLIVEVTP